MNRRRRTRWVPRDLRMMNIGNPGKLLNGIARLTTCTLVFGLPVFCQAINNRTLTRDDVVVNRDKPTVYICADADLMNKDKEIGGDVWLRINNNTIWTIRFEAERMGTKQQLFKLPNGQKIAALSKASIAFPRYEIESKKTGEGLSLWGDVHTFNWLLSNNSAIFKVPGKYFKDNLLYIDIVYGWELVGTLARESNPPHHRVYFAVHDSTEISGSKCN